MTFSEYDRAEYGGDLRCLETSRADMAERGARVLFSEQIENWDPVLATGEIEARVLEAQDLAACEIAAPEPELEL